MAASNISSKMSSPMASDILRIIEYKGFSLVDLLVVNRTPAGTIETYDCVLAKTEMLQ
jgi:hypothetical protein